MTTIVVEGVVPVSAPDMLEITIVTAPIPRLHRVIACSATVPAARVIAIETELEKIANVSITLIAPDAVYVLVVAGPETWLDAICNV